MKVELREIRKYFGPVRANDGISLTLQEGTIHGLLGENGAGKTTLMKVLAGYLTPDGGQIVLDGKPASFSSPADAIRAGIGMLHQDPLDFPSMTVLDNFVLGRDTGLRPNRARARENLLNLTRRFGFAIDPQVEVSRLTIGERQQLEVIRLLSLGVD
ncbi:MAG: ATP-binding cassette domain-containing protein, partial [Chloroflexi bacterium]